MGKGVADARMSALETTHPSTVLVRLGGRDAKSIKAICEKADHECKFSSTLKMLKCTASRLHHVFDILCGLEEAGIQASLGCQRRTVDVPDDILSALEHFMGTEGKAREMVCPGCKSH